MNPLDTTLAIAKPHVLTDNNLGLFVSHLERTGHIYDAFISLFDEAMARDFYAEHVNQPYWNDLCAATTSSPCFVFVLKGPAIRLRWRAALGPTDPNKARVSAPTSVRAVLGKYGPYNAGHGTDAITEGPDSVFVASVNQARFDGELEIARRGRR